MYIIICDVDLCHNKSKTTFLIFLQILKKKKKTSHDEISHTKINVNITYLGM